VILADIGIQRARAHAQLVALLAATGLPCATMVMGRTALDEYHPAHIGVYDGNKSFPPAVKDVVESSDCVICVGVNLTDYNTGGFTAQLDERTMVDIKLNVTKVKKARFEGVRSVDVLRALTEKLRRRDAAETAYAPRRSPQNGVMKVPAAQPGAPVLADTFLAALQALLQPGDVLIMETFTLTFASVPMRIPSGVEFFTQALWGSIGFATPAAGGAARALKAIAATGAADPRRRVVLVTGDGSLQMSAPALADMLRDGMAPLVLVVNNDGCVPCHLCALLLR
jgi:indolepyruvate decarboxylase